MATRLQSDPDPESVWATTHVEGYKVRLYKFSGNTPYWGYTIAHPGVAGIICIHESLLKKGKEKKLHAVLNHEFIHVCESVFFWELCQPHPDGCSTWARVFGDRVPELFENMHRLGVRELAAVKDAVARRKDGNKRKSRKA